MKTQCNQKKNKNMCQWLSPAWRDRVKSVWLFNVLLSFLGSCLNKFKYNHMSLFSLPMLYGGFPGGTSGKELTCQCRRCKRHSFDSWIGKIPWRRECILAVFLLGESHGQMDREAWWATFRRVAQSQTWVKQLSMHATWPSRGSRGLSEHPLSPMLMLTSKRIMPPFPSWVKFWVS